jgi:hypothetical protein
MKIDIKLRFFANPDSNTLVSDHEALANGMVRYIGRRWDKEQSAFVPTETPHEVSYAHEYVQAAKRGDILPADSETSDKCGIKYTTTSYVATNTDLTDIKPKKRS